MVQCLRPAAFIWPGHWMRHADCKSFLTKLHGDPWAREALSALQARLTQVDALAEDVAEYVNNQLVTLMDAIGITHASVGTSRGAARSP